MRLKQILFIFFIISTNSFAHKNTITFYDLNYVSKSINLEKNVMRFGFDLGFSDNKKYYNKSGKQASFSGAKDQEFGLNFITEYGATNNFSFGLLLPFLYKNFNSGLGSASSYGMGDAKAFMFYQIYGLSDPLLSTGLNFIMKFPSGSTAIFDSSGNAEVPLGNGVIELEVGPQTKIEFIPNFMAFKIGGSYVFKLNAVAEYIPIYVQDVSGIVALGNNEVDFGDSLKAFGELGMQWGESFWVGASSDIQYDKRTKVGESYVVYNSTDPASSSGYILNITPEIRLLIEKNCELNISNDFPILGKRYPLVDYSMVSGFIGNINLTMGLSYYF